MKTKFKTSTKSQNQTILKNSNFLNSQNYIIWKKTKNNIFIKNQIVDNIENIRNINFVNIYWFMALTFIIFFIFHLLINSILWNFNIKLTFEESIYTLTIIIFIVVYIFVKHIYIVNYFKKTILYLKKPFSYKEYLWNKKNDNLLIKKKK